MERSSPYAAPDVGRAGIRTAKEALKGRGVKIGLDAGPLSELMEPYGDLTEEETAQIYAAMFEAGVKEGADLIFLETFIDLALLRVAAE